MRLSQRLFLFALLALMPALLVLWLLEHQLRVDREREIRDLAERQTLQATSTLDRLVESQRLLLSAVVAAPGVQTFDDAVCSPYLTRLAASLANVDVLVALDSTGLPRCRDDAGREASYADADFFKDALAGDTFVVGTFTRNAHQDAILPFAAPIRDGGGRTIGVVMAGLKLQFLQDMVARWKLPPDGSLTMADRNGVIIARSPLPERFVGTRIPDEYIRRWVHAERPGTETVLSQDGTERILSYHPVGLAPEGLYVSSGFSRDQAFASLDRNWVWNLAVAASAIAGAILMSTLAARYLIQRPANDLMALARAWSAGAPGRVQRPIPMEDFEIVAKALDDMGRAILERAEAEARMQDLMVKELHHRVKNLLTVVQAIGTQTAQSVGAPPAFSQRFRERLQALGRTTDMLTVQNWDGVSVRALIQSEMAAVPHSDRVAMTGDDVELPAQLALSLTLILHEMATNAVKYGCLSEHQPGGRLTIDWTVEIRDGGRQITIKWDENCPAGISTEGGTAGFGSRLIHRTISSIGRGNVELFPQGLRAEMILDLP